MKSDTIIHGRSGDRRALAIRESASGHVVVASLSGRDQLDVLNAMNTEQERLDRSAARLRGEV